MFGLTWYNENILINNTNMGSKDDQWNTIILNCCCMLNYWGDVIVI